MKYGSLALMTLLLLLPLSPRAREVAATLEQAAAAGRLAFKLTEPAEIRVLIGDPASEETRVDGGMTLKMWTVDAARLLFGRRTRDEAAPFTLLRLWLRDAPVDIGENRPLALRSAADLAKIDGFDGLQNVSLTRLDLSGERDLLDRLPFDTLTGWPGVDSLPSGFVPADLLRRGGDPGLGLRALHAEGIDGRGVGVAVIDQPLLRAHVEYAGRLARYDAAGVEDFPPQMHASPIASILVGRRIGVAPGASLAFFAVPMWEQTNAHYLRALRSILETNRALPAADRIRVVSISDGTFAQRPGADAWADLLERAEAEGVLVVTCAPGDLHLGTLTRIEGRDPDRPDSYRAGAFASPEDRLRAPAGNRTLASHRGETVYWYDREGGRSWAAPYVAGCAALAWQVNPELTPADVRRLLVETAFDAGAGPVVDPRGLVEAARMSGGLGLTGTERGGPREKGIPED